MVKKPPGMQKVGSLTRAAMAGVSGSKALGAAAKRPGARLNLPARLAPAARDAKQRKGLGGRT
jgi:hypothetical protein